MATKDRGIAGASKEGVDDAQVGELLAVLEIFGVEDAAVGFEGGGDDEGVVPGEGEAAGKIEGTLVEREGGMYRKERSKRIQLALCFGEGHPWLEAPEGDTEVFLHDLEANDTFARNEGAVYQAGSNGLFRRGGWSVLVDEDIGVKEKSIAHSSHRECKGRQRLYASDCLAPLDRLRGCVGECKTRATRGKQR